MIFNRRSSSNVRIVLILARAFIRSYWYIVLFGIFLSGLSLDMLRLMMHLIKVTQSNVQLNFLNHAAYNQLIRNPVESSALLVFLIFVYLWTHGFLIALSNYIGESMAIHWYFNEKNRIANIPYRKTWLFDVLK
jgi:hypothetical protein